MGSPVPPRLTYVPDAISLEDHIARLVVMYGSWRKASAALDIELSYLHRLSKGEILNPAEDTLKRLGLRRLVYYTTFKAGEQ